MTKKDEIKLKDATKQLENEGYTVIPDGYVRCSECGKNKSVKQNNFYTSNSPLHSSITASYEDKGAIKKYNYIPICKQCLLKNYDHNDIASTIKVLCILDKPFIPDIWTNVLNRKSKASSTNVFGTYIKDLNLNYKNLRFFDGETSLGSTSQQESENMTADMKNITLSKLQRKRLISEWGTGYNDSQYIELESMYQSFLNESDIDGSGQKEYLRTACLYQLKNKEAIRDGNATEAKSWGKLFDDYMGSGKLKPSQMSESDKMGGITNFSNFFTWVEKSNKFIPKFPDLLLDDVDAALLSYTNHVREMAGEAPFELGEVRDISNYDYEIGQEIIFPKKDKESDSGDIDG